MPTARMLPLGTVVKPKRANPGWEKLRFIVTGYFSCSEDGKTDWDYIMTPWPLGALRIEGGDDQVFCSCNEDAIGEVESLGAVSEEGCSWMGETLDEMIARDDACSPLAQSKESMALAYGDLPCTMGADPSAPTSCSPWGRWSPSASTPARRR